MDLYKRSTVARAKLLDPEPDLPCHLSVLENDAAKGKTGETTEYKPSKAIIQNYFYSKYAVPPIWGATASTVHAL